MEATNAERITRTFWRYLMAFLAVALIFILAAQAASAAPILDQSNSTYNTEYTWGTATNGGNTRTVCQSFVPTKSSIVQVDFTLGINSACTYQAGAIEFFLTSGNCAGNGGTTLSSHVLTSGEYNSFINTSPLLANWTLASQINVTPGTTYYVAMRDQLARNLCYETKDNSTSAYANGIEKRGLWNDTFADQSSRDIYFSTYYNGLGISVSATNTPAVSGGIRWSGYGTLPSQLVAGEVTINFWTRIFSNALGVDEAFTVNSTSSTAPGYYETPSSAIGLSWPPGSYTVVTTQQTNQRTGSATTTITVLSYPGASGVPVGGGGGSWGDEGLPPELSGGVPVDGGLTACLTETFTTDLLEYLTNPAETFIRVYQGVICFLNSGLSVIKGVAPFKWAYQVNGYWNTAVTSATATVNVALSVPDNGAGARTITLIDSASSGAGIRGKMAAHSSLIAQAHTLMEYVLYLLFAVYLLWRAFYHPVV